MLQNIPEEDLEIAELFYYTPALIESLFSDFDNLAIFDPEKFGEVRLGQLPLLSYEYLLDEDSRLGEKKNMELREGAGSIYCFGGRNFGKSLCVETLDIPIAFLLLEPEHCGFTSLDAMHIRGILEKVCIGFSHHPFLSILDCQIKRSPNYSILARNGYLLESVNMNLQGSEPGSAFFQKHFKRLYVEENSFESDEVYRRRQDSVDEDGCVIRSAGMTNFTKYSPPGRIYYDAKKKSIVVNLPQYINPKFDHKKHEEAKREHGGEQCFDEQTEILTECGWKKYNEITLNDKVLSLNIENGIASYEKITNIFIYDYEGELNVVDKQSGCFAITDDHRLLYNTSKNKKLRMLSLRDIFANKKAIKKQRTIEKTDICLQCNKLLDKHKKQKYFCSRSCQNKFQKFLFYPVNKIYIKRDFKFLGLDCFNNKKIKFKSNNNAFSYSFILEDWFEFLGWFISEGSITENNRKKYTGIDYCLYEIQIAQSNFANPDKVNIIHSLLKRMGVTYTYYDDNEKGGAFRFTSKLIGKHLIEYCGKGSYNKKIPQYAKNANPKLLKIILKSLVGGDGSILKRNNNCFCYTTFSKQLADDVQEIIYKLGMTSNIDHIEGNKGYVVFNRLVNKNFVVYKNQIEKKKYNGKVWCVETLPYNTVFVRRNRKCMWSGNSLSFRMFVKGEIVEEGVSVFDMQRVKLNYNEEKIVKSFEINRDNFYNFENVIVVDRMKQANKVYVCFDKETEVLTEDGWKYFKDITLNDKVLTLNPNTDESYFKNIKKIIDLPYEGELLNFSNHSINFSVTPNHRMYVKRAWKEKFEFIEAKDLIECRIRKDLGNYIGYQNNPEKFIIEKEKGGKKLIFDYKSFVEFLGWYLSEGSIIRNTYTISISQSEKVNLIKRNKIENCLKKLNLHFCKTDQAFIINNKTLYFWLKRECYLINDLSYKKGKTKTVYNSYTKKIPLFIKKLNKDLLNVFLDSYIDGDGHRSIDGRIEIKTCSKFLADDLQEIILKTGKIASINGKKGYVINIWRKKWYSKLIPNKIEKKKYNDRVYCIEVEPFHTIYVRRNRVSYWCGNCADIGETAPTEIIIVFEADQKYYYTYNITLYNLTDKEQFKVFKWLAEKIGANVISLDTTDGTGRAIYRSLEEIYPKDNLVWCSFNERIPIDFERDGNNNVMFSEGNPKYREEYVTEWSVKRLKDLLYEKDKFNLALDYKLDMQLNSVISMQSGSRVVYACTNENGDHIFAAFRVFAIAQWEKEFSSTRPVSTKKFAKFGC